MTMLEITEDAHIMQKKTGKITKYQWADWMKNFIDGTFANKQSTGQFLFT